MRTNAKKRHESRHPEGAPELDPAPSLTVTMGPERWSHFVNTLAGFASEHTDETNDEDGVSCRLVVCSASLTCGVGGVLAQGSSAGFRVSLLDTRRRAAHVPFWSRFRRIGYTCGEKLRRGVTRVAVLCRTGNEALGSAILELDSVLGIRADTCFEVLWCSRPFHSAGYHPVC